MNFTICKLILFTTLLINTLSLNEQCKLEAEICSCVEPYLFGKIQMNCFESTSLNKSIRLSFETLTNLPSNTTSIVLKIKNKLIHQLDTMTSKATNSTRRVTSLTLEDCKISHIFPNSFSTLNSLQELYLSMNDIETLAENSFKGLESTLKKLELHSNRIKSLSHHLFSDLLLLDYLDLRVNEMNSFVWCGSVADLKTLYLTSNKLKQVRKGFFANLKSLDLLGLSGNEIEHIEINSFNETLMLNTLYLSSNKLSQIKRGHFSNLYRLETLWLHRNEIRFIESGSFRDLFNLKILYLSSNKLKSIQRGQFDFLRSLATLHMYQNEIVNIEDDSFRDMSNLNELNLYANKISKITLSNFSQLCYLNLSYNLLVSLVVLNNLPKLIHLDLSHNYLDGFMEGVFEKLSLMSTSLFVEFNLIQRLSKKFLHSLHGEFLKVLSLKSNSLNYIEDFSFERAFRIESLFLDLNCLSRLSENSMANLTHLKHLSMSSNRIRDLGCIRQSLAHLISLESIDLSMNLIEFINDTDFKFSLQLNSINLNGNQVKKIHQNALKPLLNLKTFKFAQKTLNFDDLFDVSIYFHENVSILSLDLSLLRIAISDEAYFKCFRYIESLKLNSVLFASGDLLNIGVFLNEKIKYLDLSENFLTRDNFRQLGTMKDLVSLYLISTKLQSLKVINFTMLNSLAYLDVSFNFLTKLNWRVFRSVSRLEYLNLNNNRISHVDPRIFSMYETNKANMLKYLYMENNQIISLDGITFTNYLNLAG
jgi:Leucine-rich repeat (LRR) protein